MKRGMDKSGLSEVITTLIIIGVSIIAIGIVWAVINNILSGSSNQVNIDKFTVKLDVSSAVMTPYGLDVVVKRDPGTGSISKLALVVSDGVRKETFQINETIEELQEKKFTLNYFGIVKSVEIVPFFSGQSGTIISGDVADTLTFGPSQTVKNMPGLISWWRFEENANDEMGRNQGTLMGDPQLVNGRYGKAYNFTMDTGTYINYGNTPSLAINGKEMTIIAWTNLNENTLVGFNPIGYGIISKGKYASPLTGYLLSLKYNNGNNVAFFGTNLSTNPAGVQSTFNLPINTWHHIAGVKNSTSLIIYVDGTKNSIAADTGNVAITPENFTIGSEKYLSGYSAYTFNGIIDEVMIFNRTLSDNDIAALYALDLG